MSETELDAISADLIAWDLVKAGPTGPQWSPRFRGAVMRAAAMLAERERAGSRPEGHPIEVAVRAALAECDLPEGAVPERRHERFLVAVEVAALPDGVLDLLGGQ